DPGVYHLAQDSDGTLWAATRAGLLRVSGLNDEVKPIAAAQLPNALSVVLSSDGSIYAGSGNGLFRVDPENDRAVRIWPAPGQPPRPVRAIAQDPRGRLWLASYGYGLAMYDPATGSAQVLQHEGAVPGSLPDDFTLQLMVDRSGLLWVGAQSGGVATTDPN